MALIALFLVMAMTVGTMGSPDSDGVDQDVPNDDENYSDDSDDDGDILDDDDDGDSGVDDDEDVAENDGDDTLTGGTFSEIYGGNGDDDITYDQRPHDSSSDGLVSGGAGDDVINVNVTADATNIAETRFFSGVSVYGDDGADTFNVSITMDASNYDPTDNFHNTQHFESAVNLRDFEPGVDTLNVMIEEITDGSVGPLINAEIFSDDSGQHELLLTFAATDTSPEFETSINLGLQSGITLDDINIVGYNAEAPEEPVTPEEPDVDEGPDVPADPDVPVDPEEPTDPEEPEDPIVEGQDFTVNNGDDLLGTGGDDNFVTAHEHGATTVFIDAGDGDDLIEMRHDGAFFEEDEGQIRLENSEIDGGAGNDTIFGQAVNSTIQGGGGDDFVELEYGSRFSVINGGMGNDTLISTDGDDMNVFVGGAGNDFIHSGGHSTVQGGAGDDDLIFDHGVYPVADPSIEGPANGSIDGGDGNDAIEINVKAHTVDWGLSSGPPSVVARGGAGADTFTVNLKLDDLAYDPEGEWFNTTHFETSTTIADFDPEEDTLNVVVEDVEGATVGPLSDAYLSVNADGEQELFLVFAATDITPQFTTSINLGVNPDLTIDDINISEEAA